jgi:hypothetical protein
MAIIIKGNVQGDIVSDGGVKNETHYHYGNEQKVEHHEEKRETHTTETINILSTQNQTVISDLWELIDKGEWMNGASAENIKEMMTRVLEHSEAMWKLLGNGRSDRIRVTWQNLIGYFSDRGLLPNTNRMGSPALNRMFFADNSKYPGIGSDSDTSYSNIDKGRPSRDNMSAGFRDVLPLLDENLPKLDKKA